MPKFRKSDRVRHKPGMIEDWERISHGLTEGMCGTVYIGGTVCPCINWDNGRRSVCKEDRLELVTEQPMEELKITKEKVLEAAAKSSAAKEALQALFPECFKQEPEYLVFSLEQSLSALTQNTPFIGFGFAPDGMKGKCLMWDKRLYEAEVGERGDYGYIAFKKKKP